jgi:hypothetical protein
MYLRISMALLVLAACSPSAPVFVPTVDGGQGAVAADAQMPDVGTSERRCGQPDTYYSAYTLADLAKLSGCTVLVGQFQEDSVVAIENFDGLQTVQKIEGNLNLFRSSGFTSLHGFENLERIEGNLSIHLCDNLTSLGALAKLRTITGNLVIQYNNKLPVAAVDELVASVAVGGQVITAP